MFLINFYTLMVCGNYIFYHPYSKQNIIFTPHEPPPRCSSHHFFLSLATTPFSIRRITPWDMAAEYGESE